MATRERASRWSLKAVAINWFQPKVWLDGTKKIFIEKSGGKSVVTLNRAAHVLGGGILLLALGMAWFGPSEDKTFFIQTNQSQNQGSASEVPASRVNGAVATLLNNGKKKLAEDKKAEAIQKQRRLSIKYSAAQVVGVKTNSPKVIQTGAKLVGFLLNTIDTRSPSSVRVRISQGGEMAGIEIERGSVLSGQYSYPGAGDKIYVSFTRLDTPDGEPKRIQAQALDSGTYAVGITGEEYSGNGAKVAASLGLSMFSGMADVLTEKESLGSSQNGVQAKPTMKNALLQGLSHSAQDQTGRLASEIGSSRDYLIVPEGKEMIIELTQDFK